MKTNAATGAVMLVAIAAIMAISLASERHETAREDPHVLVEDSLGQGTTWKAKCPTVDGGVDANVLANVDGGAIASVTDWTVQNNSASTVRVGLDSSVDGSHGFKVTAGSLFPMHAKLGRCQSEGPAAIVDVGGGRP